MTTLGTGLLSVVWLLLASAAPPATTDTGPSPERRLADPNDLHDITNIEEVPSPPPGFPWSRWIKASLVVGLPALAGLAWLGWALRRRLRRRPVALPPDQWALRELARIEALDLPASQEFERYHRLLSDVVRRYLELRFGFPAPEQTSIEIVQALEKSDVASDVQSLLQDLLKRCDLAKFAAASSSLEECRAVAEMARKFVELTAKPPAPTATPTRPREPSEA